MRPGYSARTVSYAARYDPDTDFDRWYTDATARAIVERVRPGEAVLELGCATGRMTAALLAAGVVVVAVDHAAPYLDRARARTMGQVDLVLDDIATVEIDRAFDHVVLANVVHEVPDRPQLFGNAARHLRAGGELHVSLQNPSSIHRLVGLELGLIGDLGEISERGRAYDTIELLDADELAALGAGAGLELVHRAGVMLKPLPNSLMATLPDEILEGFVAVARRFPDHSSMNYLVFRKAGGGSAR